MAVLKKDASECEGRGTVMTGTAACAHHEEHWEVVVQVEAGGSFRTFTDGPHVLYPDAASAGQWAVRLQPVYYCVRVKHIMTDWLMPEDAANTAESGAPAAPGVKIEGGAVWDAAKDAGPGLVISPGAKTVTTEDWE